MTLRTDLDRLAATATALRPATLSALRRIAELERDVDGFPPRSDNTGGSRGSTSPVERVVLGPGHSPLALTRDRQALTVGIEHHLAGLEHLLRLAARYGAVPISSSALRCTGGDGTPGALEWGDPGCTNIAEAGRSTGLCVACRNRRDRWKRTRAEVA